MVCEPSTLDSECLTAYRYAQATNSGGEMNDEPLVVGVKFPYAYQPSDYVPGKPSVIFLGAICEVVVDLARYGQHISVFRQTALSLSLDIRQRAKDLIREIWGDDAPLAPLPQWLQLTS